MAGLRHHHEPRRRAEGAAAQPRRRRSVPNALPTRSAGGSGAGRAARGPDPRLRRRRRQALCDDAADRRQDRPRTTRAGAAEPATGRAHRRADRRCAPRRAPRRTGAPRRQAVQHPGDRRRLRLPHRLRHRPRSQRDQADQYRIDDRHVGLHGAGAIHQRSGRCPGRHLRADVRVVRMPDGRTAIPGGQRGTSARRPPDAAAAAAIDASPGGAAAAGRRRRQGHGEGRRPSLRHDQGAGRRRSRRAGDARRTRFRADARVATATASTATTTDRAFVATAPSTARLLRGPVVSAHVAERARLSPLAGSQCVAADSGADVGFGAGRSAVVAGPGHSGADRVGRRGGVGRRAHRRGGVRQRRRLEQRPRGE